MNVNVTVRPRSDWQEGRGTNFESPTLARVQGVSSEPPWNLPLIPSYDIKEEPVTLVGDEKKREHLSAFFPFLFALF